jgi:hypothetical protein
VYLSFWNEAVGGPQVRCALAVSYFADGANFHSDVLHMGAVSAAIRGVEFALEVPFGRRISLHARLSLSLGVLYIQWAARD